MAKFLGVDVAKLVNRHIGSRLDPATLYHATVGERDEDDPLAGREERRTQHAARGFFEEYADARIDGTTILRGDRKVILIGDSISPPVRPMPGDEILLLGERVRIVEHGVSSDPARATYTCHTRAF